MKRRILLLGGMLLVASSIFAAPCVATQSVATLVGFGAAGCEMGNGAFTIAFGNLAAPGSAAQGSAHPNLILGSPMVTATTMGLFGFASTEPATGSLKSTSLEIFASALSASNSAGDAAAVTEGASPSSVTPIAAAQIRGQFPSSPESNLFSEPEVSDQISVVPEPLSLCLVGSGLIVFGILGRKQMAGDQVT